VENRVSYRLEREIIAKSQKSLVTHKDFSRTGGSRGRRSDHQICRFVLKMVDRSGGTRKWKSRKKIIKKYIYHTTPNRLVDRGEKHILGHHKKFF
jgi:hypothetical protein